MDMPPWSPYTKMNFASGPIESERHIGPSSKLGASSIVVTDNNRYDLYAALLLAQTGGVAVILWHGVPLYRLIIKNPGPEYAELSTFVWAIMAVLAIQTAYWLRMRLIPTISLSPNIILNHILLFLARMSFVFATAFFSTIVFLRLPDISVSVPRIVLLVFVMFSLFCYSLELEQLGYSFRARS
jgi:hypothetical protein